ncbi:MAG: PilZ domain-containing protein [Roseiarcus sp.]
MADGQDEAKAQDTKRSMRVVLQARASYSDGAISTQCTVNELSDVGARINIATSFSLPETFDINIPQRNLTRRAKLLWRTGNQAGLEFIEADAATLSPFAHDPTARIKALEAENAKLKAQIGVLMQQVQRLTEA